MKILYLVSEYPKVSHSFIRREIAALEQQGHLVVRMAIRGWDLPLKDERDAQERRKTQYVLQQGWGGLFKALAWCVINRLPGFLKAFKVMWAMARRADKPLPYHLIYLAEAAWLAKAIQRQQVDHIHAHFGTNPAEVAALLSCMTGIAYSFTAHGPDEFDRPEALHLKDKVALAKFVVVVSDYGRSQMMRWVRFEDWPKVKVVHCGLDQQFLSAAVTAPPANHQLVCVGRLSGQKGQMLLLEAVAQLRSRGQSIRLVLAGDGELRSVLESKADALGIGEYVHITGWIDGEEVKQWLVDSRALVLPSFAEGLPVVIMEAMAMGRPVISTYIAGIPELVQHGVNGWLCPAGSVEAVAHAMSEALAANAEQLAKMGDASTKRVAQRHDVMTEAAKLARYMVES